jgi:hypothetical protein
LYRTYTTNSMRIIAQIPHNDCRISIFSMNQKFIIKVEWGPYEQSYKVSEMDIPGLEQIKAMITDDFIRQCMARFEAMDTDFNALIEAAG